MSAIPVLHLNDPEFKLTQGDLHDITMSRGVGSRGVGSIELHVGRGDNTSQVFRYHQDGAVEDLGCFTPCNCE